MSVTSRSPLRMAGANVNSGHPNTGEVPMTRGGMQRWGANSGGIRALGSGSPNPPAGAIVVTGDHALIFSGAGRLNTVFPHTAISGVSLVLYDSSVVAASGPGTWSQSGYPVLGVLPANTWNPAGGTLVGIHPPIQFDMPFHSGLCVAGASGIPQFSISFTPETNLPNPG